VSDVQVRVQALYVHPVKSCGVVGLNEVLVIETGFEFDRAWMVVDTNRRFVTQRELPRMALVQQTLKHSELVLRAPGMIALHLALDAVRDARRVQVWDDEVAAYDMGDLAAQWFSDFLGRPLRLVRFDPQPRPDQRRLSSRDWTTGPRKSNVRARGGPALACLADQRRGGSGMNSVSPGTVPRRCASQSSCACTMRSLRLDTKFQTMKRWPSGAPPTNAMRAPRAARSRGSCPSGSTTIVQAGTATPSSSNPASTL
jgi:hypothetical protein